LQADAAAVEDRSRRVTGRRHYFIDQRHDAGDLIDSRWRATLTNCPDGFVGNDDLADLGGRQLRQCDLHLNSYEVLGASDVTNIPRLADADQRNETMGNRRRDL
jgi:hypothetical protein